MPLWVSTLTVYLKILQTEIWRYTTTWILPDSCSWPVGKGPNFFKLLCVCHLVHFATPLTPQLLLKCYFRLNIASVVIHACWILMPLSPFSGFFINFSGTETHQNFSAELMSYWVGEWKAVRRWQNERSKATRQCTQEGSGPEAQEGEKSSKLDAKLKLASELWTCWQTEWSGRKWRGESLY